MSHDLQLTVVMVIVEPGPASTLWLQLQTVSLEVIYSCQKCSFQMLENASPTNQLYPATQARANRNHRMVNNFRVSNKRGSPLKLTLLLI